MNPMPPMLCGTLLAAMMAAGISHYWSVENFIATYPTVPAMRMLPVDSIHPASDSPGRETENAGRTVELTTAPPSPADAGGTEFFKELMLELRNLRNENKALNNQIAETNRDVMKMQFQIDTHSESFRPMPTSDDRDDRSQMYDDDFPGVLPPRAEPVYPIGD